jgi:hypothetical protein
MSSDRLFSIWIAGAKSGIYVIAEIVEAPRTWKSRPDIGY